MRKLPLSLSSLVLVLLWSGQARAIPAFARKYQTSCTTCHTAWPMLNPYGEAFRRNGFRFPGDDNDAVKQEMTKLGNDAYKKVFPNAVWPAVIPDSVPIAFGFIGNAALAPVAGSAASASSPGTQTRSDGTTVTTPYFSLTNLVTEAHIWSGGTFDNSLSFFGEVTLSTDPGNPVNIERGYLIFDDILSDWVGPHVFNILVGKNFPTITSFDNHSSYVVDGYVPEINLPPMLNGNIAGSYTPGINELGTVELNGTVAGRFSYSLGVNAGLNDYTPPSGGISITPSAADAFAHVGVKLGGMRLDGEGGGQVSSNAWEETALTIDVFGYHSESYYNDEAGPPPGNRLLDTAETIGGALHGQYHSLTLVLGALDQFHNHPDATGISASALTGWGEASYVVFPWLIPALRIEATQVNSGTDSMGNADPNFTMSATGFSHPVLVRYMPALDFVIRPNIVLALVAEIDHANGAPPAGWGGAGGVIGFPLQTNATAVTGTEFETLTANLRWAF